MRDRTGLPYRPGPDATDEEVNEYAAQCYDRSLGVFLAMAAAVRKPRRRRRFSDFTRANCEEAYGSSAAHNVVPGGSASPAGRYRRTLGSGHKF